MLNFDPFDQVLHDDPYPTYARLREEAPLYRNDELDFWALSRHEDVFRVLRDYERFSSTYGASLETWGPNANRTSSFIAMDPPRHTYVRGLISRVFTTRGIARLEPRIRELARDHLHVAIEQGSFDFVADYAAKIPMDVIFELIGVPSSDRPEMATVARLIFEPQEGTRELRSAAKDATREIIGYYAELIAERRRNPVEDLTSVLVRATIDGAELRESEIIAMLFLLGVAGNETTTKLLGNAWYWAWRNPDQRAKAFSGRITDWVEETLRYDSAGQVVLRRAVADVSLYGARIPAGARLLLLEASANRDPRVFSEPDRFDLDRDTGRLLSFGSGIHFCLGAALARLMANTVLQEATTMFEQDYEIDPDGIRRAYGASTRGFASLPTRAKPRSAADR